MMVARLRAAVTVGALVFALSGVASNVEARPTYFDELMSTYGYVDGDDMYACGNCHIKWEGTGARNLFGAAIEQELYVGKTIMQAIADIAGDDSDGDGFTNDEELGSYATLPGFSCDDYFLAKDAPANWHTFVTPMVATCLEPLDIRLFPTTMAMISEVGETQVIELEVFNNGSSLPLNVSSYGITVGSHAAYSVSGPAAPFSIPVGGSVILDVMFSPTAITIANGAMRVSSDDPDEPDADVLLSGFGFVIPLAPPADRAACLGDVDKRYRRFTKKRFREWERCYVDEVSGVACDSGRRDLKIQQLEAQLRLTIGGSLDSRCTGNGLTPIEAGLGDSCPAPCESIGINTMAGFADCLICRHDDSIEVTLSAATGAAPPDLPLNVLSSDSLRCQRKLLSEVRKGISRIQKALGRCELANITAGTPVDCSVAKMNDIDKVRAKVNKRIARCIDTTGMLGCLFEGEMPDPECLADKAISVGTGLVDTTFGLD